MRLLFDQNLSPRLVRLLGGDYPGSEHVRDVGLATANDDIIWRYAAREALTIVSKDIDFEQKALLLGHPPKVVRIKVGNCSTTQVKELLAARRGDLELFEADLIASVLSID